MTDHIEALADQLVNTLQFCGSLRETALDYCHEYGIPRREFEALYAAAVQVAHMKWNNFRVANDLWV